jgi:uncharacterized membrane protein YcgQ (UPF0703/DUF1980 family)
MREYMYILYISHILCLFLTSIQASGPTPSTVTVSHFLLRMNFLAVGLFSVAIVTGTCHRKDSKPARKI